MSNTLLEPTQQQNNPVSTTKLFQLYYEKGLSLREIEKITGLSNSGIYQRLRRFNAVLPEPDVIQAYEQNKTKLLSAAECVLLENMFSTKKLKDASLNNVAYAFQQINNANRLEKGQSTENIAVSASLQQTRTDLDQIQSELEQLGLNSVEITQVNTPELSNNITDNSPQITQDIDKQE